MTRIAICIDNTEYPAALERHKAYPVVSDPAAESEGALRVIDESGEDYLYAAERFLLMKLSPE